METVIRRRLGWRRKLFHPHAMPHSPVGKGLLFNFDDGLIFHELPGFRVVSVTNHTLRWYGLDVMLGPDILLCDGLHKKDSDRETQHQH